MRAVLALAHDGGAGQDDRQHGDVVDDAHDAGEPGGRDVGIEGDADDEIDRGGAASLAARETKLRDLGRR